jgi:negative regulator of flagellin synthesis FlgM
MKISNPSAKGSTSISSSVGADEIAKSSRARDKASASIGKSETEKAGMADSARVDMSTRAVEMNRAKEIASSGVGVDEAKVARLQKLIDGGNYKVDAEAIADRLLDEHLKMPM